MGSASSSTPSLPGFPSPQPNLKPPGTPFHPGPPPPLHKAALPSSHVFKAFNTIGVEHLAAPEGADVFGSEVAAAAQGPISMLYAGGPEGRDTAAAVIKAVVRAQAGGSKRGGLREGCVRLQAAQGCVHSQQLLAVQTPATCCCPPSLPPARARASSHTMWGPSGAQQSCTCGPAQPQSAHVRSTPHAPGPAPRQHARQPAHRPAHQAAEQCHLPQAPRAGA